MNKLLFSILLVSLLALPAAAVNSCFEATELPPLTFVQNNVPRFTIGADGRFYIGGKIDGLSNAVVYVNKNNAWDRFVVPNMVVPSSLQAHPDASKASWVFAGTGTVGTTNTAYAVTFDSQLWITKPGTEGVSYLYYATSSQLFKSILIIDSITSKLYNLTATTPSNPTHLGEVGVLPQGVIPTYVSASGSKVYTLDKAKRIHVGVWDPSSSKFLFTLQGTATSPNTIMKLVAASNGKVYYGDNQGVVSNALDAAEPALFTLDGQLSDLLEYNNSIIGITGGNTPAKSDKLFFVHNGTTTNYVLVNSTFEQPDFRPRKLAVNPIDGKLYLLAFEAQAFKVYRIKPTCLGFTVAPPVNNAPVISMEGGNLTTSVNSNVTLTVTASDPDGQLLNYTWTKVQGPALGNLTDGGVNQSFVKYNFTNIGFYIFNVFVNDSGTPSMSATRNFTVNVTTPAPAAPALPAAPLADECTESDDCAANQMCNSDSECEALVCNDDETVSNHECVPEETGTLCGDERFEGDGTCCGDEWKTGEGICCTGEWKEGETSCTVTRNTSVGTRAGTNNTNSPQAMLENLTKSPMLLYGGIAIVVILLLVIVYFVFLKKKPPVEEASEEESEAESTEEPQVPTG